MRKKDTDLGEVGDAMARCVEHLASVYKHTRKQGSDAIDFVPWWRESDSTSATLFIAKASIHDIKLGETHNGKEFAALIGLTLPQLIAQYGRLDLGPAVRAGRPVESRWEGAREAYEAAVARTWGDGGTAQEAGDGGAGLPDDAVAFLRRKGCSIIAPRDLPIAMLDAEAVRDLPQNLRHFASQRVGRAIITPLVGLRSGEIRALSIRAFDGDKRTAGSISAWGESLVFGTPLASSRAAQVVLTEGATDALSIMSRVRSDARVVALGAYAVSTMADTAAQLALTLRPDARLVIIADIDLDSGIGLRGAVAAMGLANEARPGCAALFNWPRALDVLSLPEDGEPARAFDIAAVLASAVRHSVSEQQIMAALTAGGVM